MLANPTNPTVVHGAASFANPAANILNVTTATSKTIINWGSFSMVVTKDEKTGKTETMTGSTSGGKTAVAKATVRKRGACK